MNDKSQQNPKERLPEDWENVIRNSKPRFSRSKEEVWDNMIGEVIDIRPEPKVFHLAWFRYAAAAAVLVVLGAGAFLRFHSESVESPMGQHTSVLLPDGSQVELNAASSMSYNPYWWAFSRSIEFEGEAFFDVEEGSRFEVVSQNGTTEVLGTSFNINSRNKGYEVYCKSGKVNVVNEKSSLILEPSELATTDLEGILGRSLIPSELEVLGWIENKFVFNAVFIGEVFDELELQFDVKIESPEIIENQKYTGSFAKSDNVNMTLEVICNSMDFSFERQSDGVYTVKQNVP